MRQFLSSTLVLAAMCAPLAAQDAEVARQTIALGDPGKPATLDVNVVMGSITVKGSNRKDVLIETRGSSPAPGARPPRQNRPDEPPPPGLRRLTQRPPIDIDQDRNTISIDVDSPLRSVDVETVMGSVSVEGVDGEVEVESGNGAVTLTNVSGSVVAHTVNGKLTATVTRAAPQQPMAFTSLNGSVDVTLPATVKANLKLRSDQGEVYTDFDLQQVRQDSSNPNPNPNPDVNLSRRGNRRRGNDIDSAIYGSVNGGGPDFEMRTFNGNVYVRKGK